MKKKSFIKRIVSFVTALSLTISSTVMILPASADEANILPSTGATCTLGDEENPCSGTYSWQDEGGTHVLKCNGTTVHTVADSSHTAGEGGANLGCDICTTANGNEQNDTTFTVTFTSSDANSNTIAVKKGTGDDVTELSTGETVTSSDTLTIVATAAENYEFKSWSVSGGVVSDSTSAETTVTGITADVSISAEFGLKQDEGNSASHKVKVVYTDSTAGTISAANGTDFDSVTAGSKVYFTASPADSDNYSIKTDEGTFVVGASDTAVEFKSEKDASENVVYSFTMPDEDVTITVEFIPIIKWTDSEDGTYTITSNYGAEKGEKCESLWINFSDLLINGRTVADVDTITFKYTYSDNSYFAGLCGICVEPSWDWFTDGKYPVGFDDKNPDIKVTNASNTDTITFDLSKKTVMGDGFDISVWASDPDSTMTISDITVNFKEYDITVDGDISNGSVSVGEKNKAQVGDEVTVTAAPTDSENYELDEIIVTYTDGNDTKLVTVTDNKFAMPAGNVNVTATFVAKGTQAVNHSVTASAVSNGEIAVKEGSSFSDVARGTAVNFTVTANDNYFVQRSSIKVKYGTISVPVEEHTDEDGNVEYYSFVMPNADVTITAEIIKAIDWTESNGTYTLASVLGSDDGEWYIDKWFDFSEFIGEDEFIGDIASISFDYSLGEDAYLEGGLLIHADGEYVQGGYFPLKKDNDVFITTESVEFEFDGSKLDEEGFSIQVYYSEPNSSITISNLKVNLKSFPDTKHNVTINYVDEYGKIEAAKGSSFENEVQTGTKVYFTAKSNTDGYNFRLRDDLVVGKTSGKNIDWDADYTDWQNPVYYFRMPDEDVTINVQFIPQKSWTDNGDGTYTLKTEYGTEANEACGSPEIKLEDYLKDGQTLADIESISFKYVLGENSFVYGICGIGATPGEYNWVQGGNYPLGFEERDKEAIQTSGTVIFDLSEVTVLYDNLQIQVWEADPNSTITISNIKVSYKTYNVNVADDIEKGSVTVSPTTAEAGTEITVTATPDDEASYKLGEITVTYLDGNATKAVTVTDNKFIMPSADVTVKATFVDKDAEVEKHSVSQGENVVGTIEATTDSSFENVAAGTVVKFTVTPEEHYTVKTGTVAAVYNVDDDNQISIEVKAYTNDNNEIEYYYFTMPNADVVISAGYLEKINWTDNNDGSYTISSVSGSDAGEGYEYLEVTLDYILDENIPISELVSFSFDYSFDTINNPDCQGGGGCWMFATGDDDDGFAFGGDYSFNNDGNGKPNGTATFRVDGSSITGKTLNIGFWWAAANTTVTISNIKANYRQHTFTVDIDGTKSAVDTWTEVYNLFNAKSVNNADIVITLNEDYTFTNKDKLPTAAKANSLTINGDGTLIFDKTVTALKFVSETTLDVKTALSASSTKKVAVSSSAANKKLVLDESFSGDTIGKLSGSNKIELVINSDVTVDQLATFKKVTTECCVLTVNGNVSGITEFDGNIRLAGGAKSTAVIDDLAANSIIDLVQDEKKVIPKLTLKDAEEITINVVDSEAIVVDLVPGTAVAYVSGKNGEKIANNITVGNTYPNVTELTANFYSKGNVIKAENNSAITLIYDGGEENCPTLEYAVDWVNNQKLSKGDTLGDVTITVNNDVTAAANFALPKKNVKTLTLNGDASITFLGTKLAILYNTTFDVTIIANNKAKTLDLNVTGKNVELVINQSTLNHVVIEADNENGIEAQDYYESYFGKVTGKSDSILTVESDDDSNANGDQISFTSIATFKTVTGDIKVNAGISKVSEFGGLLVVEGDKSTAEITKIISAVDGDSTSIILRETSLNALPKFTITCIDEGTTLYFKGVANNWNDLNLETGRTILYTKDNKFAEDGDTLGNIVIQCNSDNEDEPTMRAVYNKKTKSVVAKSNNVKLVQLETYTDDVTDCTVIENGNEGFYETFEEAIAYIDKNGTATTNFKITVKESIEVANFALPKAKKAKEITIVCDGDISINVGKKASATANSDIVLDNAMFKATVKNLTLTSKGNVTINGNTCFDVFKGGKNCTMTVIGCSIAKSYDVSGFGDVIVKKGDSGENGMLMINTTLNVEKLTLKENSELVINDTLKTGTFKKFEAEDNAAFSFWSVGKNTLKYAGKAADFIAPADGVKINAWYGVKVLSTKVLTDLNGKFTYGGEDPISYTAYVAPCFAQVGNDIVLLSEIFELKQGDKTIETYAQWTDAVNYINNFAKTNKQTAKNTEYTITLHDYVYGTTAIKFPNANTYKKLTVRTDDQDRKRFSFTGSLSLTGATTFENIFLVSLDKKENITKFNINSSYDLDLENVLAQKVTIKAKNLVIRDFSIWGEKITVSETLTTKDACIDTTGLTTKNWVLESGTHLNVVNNSKVTVKNTIKRAEGVENPDDVCVWLTIIEKDKDSNGENVEVTTFKKSYKVASVKTGADLISYDSAEYAFVNDGKGNLTIQKRPWTFTGKTIVFSSLYGKATEYVEYNDGHYMISNFLDEGRSNTDVKSITFSVNFKKGKAGGCIGTSNNDTSKDGWGEWMLSAWDNESTTVTLDFGDYGIYAEREDLLFQIWGCEAKTEIEFKVIDIQYK